MHGTRYTEVMQADGLRPDVYATLTGTPHIGFVEPAVVGSPDARRGSEPGTVMLSADDRHRQLEIVVRRLVEAVTARREATA